MTLDSIRHPLPDNYEYKRFQHMEDRGHWGVWDFMKGEWRRLANYTRRDAARMSIYLNRTLG